MPRVNCSACGTRLLLGDVAFQCFDADRLVNQIAPARHLAEAHADAAAGGRHRVLLQDHAERVLGLAVSDIVDVARHVDLRGAGLDARRRHIAHAVLIGRRSRRQLRLDDAAEVVQRRDQRFGAALAQSAQRRLRHQAGQPLDAVEVERAGLSLAHRGERIAHQNGAHATGRAFAAGLVLSLLHVAPEGVDQTDARIKDEEATIAEKGANRVAFVEFIEAAKPRDRRRLASRFGPVIVHLAVPVSINHVRHCGPSLLTTAASGYGRPRDAALR